MKALLFALALANVAHADGIVERRIWIEHAIDGIKEEQCQDSVKKWRCLFPDRLACQKTMTEAFAACSDNVLPDLPEYISDAETKAKANQVVVDCMTQVLTKKYVLALSKEKMEDYGVCNGSIPRSKPLSPSLQKALDFSKTQTTASCADGGFFRKCFSLPASACNDMLAQHQQTCTLKMESDGTQLKSDESAIQDAGRKITDCALQNMRNDLDKTRKRIKDKDC